LVRSHPLGQFRQLRTISDTPLVLTIQLFAAIKIESGSKDNGSMDRVSDRARRDTGYSDRK